MENPKIMIDIGSIMKLMSNSTTSFNVPTVGSSSIRNDIVGTTTTAHPSSTKVIASLLDNNNADRTIIPSLDVVQNVTSSAYLISWENSTLSSGRYGLMMTTIGGSDVGTAATIASGGGGGGGGEENHWDWAVLLLVCIQCVLIVITVIGNTLVILSVMTTRRLRTVTNCFVMSLAVADWLVGIFVMPPAVAVHLIGKYIYFMIPINSYVPT